VHTRFRKGQSGNPGGRNKKKLHALLAACSASPPSAPDLGGAREHAYTAVDRIAWPEGFCRRNIAAPR
jgi:phosphoribosylamine---glycine ligase